ncbi:hypothetical protein GCM10009555_023450 [Acrocarpospora macrocephala]|uniref:Carbamoyl-phosphate synthase small subunit N-terminal domain-containing protein n=1 Tax=Acrocarpospora macrocephala TaxID=150177 RepID=A0A5M3WSB6_9ACTN|nr:hypothetical protein Amac_058740 [Acrocarpospora macrocephala]
MVRLYPRRGPTSGCVNEEDPESGRVWVAGYVVREPARVASNWRATTSLEDYLRRQGVVGIAVRGTRALTRHLRERGAMRAGVFSGDALAPVAELVARVQRPPGESGPWLTSLRRPVDDPAATASYDHWCEAGLLTIVSGSKSSLPPPRSTANGAKPVCSPWSPASSRLSRHRLIGFAWQPSTRGAPTSRGWKVPSLGWMYGWRAPEFHTPERLRRVRSSRQGTQPLSGSTMNYPAVTLRFITPRKAELSVLDIRASRERRYHATCGAQWSKRTASAMTAPSAALLPYIVVSPAISWSAPRSSGTCRATPRSPPRGSGVRAGADRPGLIGSRNCSIIAP